MLTHAPTRFGRHSNINVYINLIVRINRPDGEFVNILKRRDDETAANKSGSSV